MKMLLAAFLIAALTVPDSARATPLPSVHDVLAAFDVATGVGAAASIRTRHSTAVVLGPKLVLTPRLHVVAARQSSRIDVYQKRPNKVLIVTTTDDVDARTGVREKVVTEDGTAGAAAWRKIMATDTWQKMSARHVELRATRRSEIARLVADAQPAFALRIRERYHDLHVIGRERVRGRDAVVLEGADAGRRRVRFFFEERSGLLLRSLPVKPILAGMNAAVAFDYDDYRELGAVAVPFRIDREVVDSPAFTERMTFMRIRDDEPLPDAMFVEPRPPSPRDATLVRLPAGGR